MTTNWPKTKQAARKNLEAYLTQVGYSVCHSRTQRNGSIRVYLFQYYGEEKIGEVRWDPRTPFTLHRYKQVWVETGHGNLGGHQEDEQVDSVHLPVAVYEPLCQFV